MKYPIDTDKYIAAMRLEFGTDPDTEQAYREYIPLVNSAYQSGRDNAPGYPMDPAATLAEFEEKSGPAPLIVQKLVAGLIRWMNKAYLQGQADANRVPVYLSRTSFLDTLEGCALANAPMDVELAVLGVFSRLPEDVKNALTFSPGAGEYLERVRFWKTALTPALPPVKYCSAMWHIIKALVRAYLKARRGG